MINLYSAVQRKQLEKLFQEAYNLKFNTKRNKRRREKMGTNNGRQTWVQ